jgi:predicted ATP-grasp superfamily ATP-dependent carboligase
MTGKENHVCTETTDMRPRLLIIGTSARAAAWSAVRAGRFPVCVDRFGDADLKQVAEVLPVDPRQCAVPTLARSAAAAHLLLCDPYPWWTADCQRLYDELERSCGPRLGCSLTTRWELAPWRLAERLRAMQCPALETRLGAGNGPEWGDLRGDPLGDHHEAARSPMAQNEQPPADGTWLQKPLASGGGRRIRFWTVAAQGQAWDEPCYFQRYQAGESYGAVFLAAHGQAELVGISQQLIGSPEAAPPWPFGYCGSIGPVALPPATVAMLQRIADGLVAGTTGLRGLFGIDFVYDGTTPWVTEVNPRYTASCELLELALRRPLLREHWRACLPDHPPPRSADVPPRCGRAPAVLGKLFVYARDPVLAPDFARFLQPRSAWTVPYLADIPAAGTRFGPGQPVCTVFASADDPDACRKKLFRRAEWLRSRLRPADP